MGKINIAIDGPAGAGKSTIAKKLARELNIYHLDTGSTYRAVAYAVLQAGKDPTDMPAVVELLKTLNIKVIYEDGLQKVLVNGVDVTPCIRTPEVTKGASDVAVIPEVRIRLVQIQRQVANDYDVVMDGRDIGTYVLPDSKNKFFLTADLTVRAKRRKLDLKKSGIKKDIRSLQAEIKARDTNDSSRTFAPLKQAADAVHIDTTDLTIAQVLDAVKNRLVLE